MRCKVTCYMDPAGTKTRCLKKKGHRGYHEFNFRY